MNSLAVAIEPVYDGSMPRQRDPNKLRAREAYELLGIPDYLFYRLVRDGAIRRYRDPYYKLGYYRRDEIEAFKRRMEMEQAEESSGK